MSKNLTGNKRIIYDSCIALYNAIQKWRSLTAESHSIILNIWSEKQEEINKGLFENMQESVLAYPPEIFKKLEKLNFSLLSKVQSLELTVEKMRSTVTKIKAVSELSDLHQSNASEFSAVMDYIPFKAWALSKFNASTEEITSMFEEEFKVKSSVCKEICHILHKSAFLFFEACWKYEPNIDKCKLDMLLSGILFELDLILEIN